jgi:hypothetical protein
MRHFASRKFFVTLLGMAAGVALQWYGKLDQGSGFLLAGLVSGYMTSNVAQKAMVK